MHLWGLLGHNTQTKDQLSAPRIASHRLASLSAHNQTVLTDHLPMEAEDMLVQIEDRRPLSRLSLTFDHINSNTSRRVYRHDCIKCLCSEQNVFRHPNQYVLKTTRKDDCDALQSEADRRRAGGC